MTDLSYSDDLNAEIALLEALKELKAQRLAAYAADPISYEPARDYRDVFTLEQRMIRMIEAAPQVQAFVDQLLLPLSQLRHWVYQWELSVVYGDDMYHEADRAFQKAARALLTPQQQDKARFSEKDLQDYPYSAEIENFLESPTSETLAIMNKAIINGAKYGIWTETYHGRRSLNR